MGDIIKVAVLHIVDKKLLMCVKKGLEVLITLGGTFEEKKDRSYEGCARREVPEETGCAVINLKYYGTFRGSRVDEPNSEIKLVCYFGTIQGIPRIQSGDSVVGFEWIDRNWESKGYKLPQTSQMVINSLIKDPKISF